MSATTKDWFYLTPDLRDAVASLADDTLDRLMQGYARNPVRDLDGNQRFLTDAEVAWGAALRFEVSRRGLYR